MFIHDDVRTLTAELVRERCGRLPQVVVGSPPCQDASCANAGGKGVDGERTGLFFEAIRLVDEIRPVWACFENVPGIRTRGADRILAALEAIGYACWPLVVGARHAGAPHKRDRVWFVAADLSRIGRGSGRSGRFDSVAEGEQEQAFHGPATDFDATREPMGKPGQPWPAGLGNAADADDIGRRGGAGREENRPETGFRPGDADGAGLALGEGERDDALAQCPAVVRAVAAGTGWNGGPDGLARSLRMADGVSAGLARRIIAAYGDAIVPQIAEAIGRSMMRLLPTDGTVLDLFAGAAFGWSLGLSCAGYTTIAACEIDPWRKEVARRQWERLHG